MDVGAGTAGVLQEGDGVKANPWDVCALCKKPKHYGSCLMNVLRQRKPPPPKKLSQKELEDVMLRNSAVIRKVNL